MAAKNMDELVALCKRRGFIYQSAEIYGGLQGVYDYGPLGDRVMIQNESDEKLNAQIWGYEG